MESIRLLNVGKSYGGARVIDDVSLDIAGNEFIVFLGAVRLRQIHAAADDRGTGDASTRARSGSASAASTTCRRASAASRWCSSTTRSIRT